jgi:hypothetical protein
MADLEGDFGFAGSGYGMVAGADSEAARRDGGGGVSAQGFEIGIRRVEALGRQRAV